ncbi:MAG: ATP-binding cassette domain-containing protein, partial [Pseudomonadota bacterium]
HEFRHLTQDAVFGLTLHDLKLRHRGHDATPFLRVHHANMRPGDWVYVRGPNGCGKSSLLKAIAGIWPYGSGEVVRPDGANLFFAGQDPDVPTRLSLKELVTYPHFAHTYTDLEVCAALSDVGLGRFIRELDCDLHHGKPWNAVMSGGQRQRLVLARILLQRPDVLLLDEACSALDRAAVAEFHRLIRAHCPRAIVISIMHEPEPPLDPGGRPYYNTILQIENGRAALLGVDFVVDARQQFVAE